LYCNIKAASTSNIEYSSLYNNLPIRQLIVFLKDQVFTLLKLIILERKVVIYSHRPSIVSGLIIALCSLLPGFLAFSGKQLSSKKIEWHLKTNEMYGLPLHIYNNKVHFLPLFSLSEINTLKELNGYTIGTTNSALIQLLEVKPDVYLNIDEAKFTILNKGLRAALKLTDYEKEFIKNLMMDIHYEPNEEHKIDNWQCIKPPTEEDNLRFAGCNHYIRQQFTDYFRELIVNLSLAEFVCRTLQPKELKENTLKEIYDDLNIVEENLTPSEYKEPPECKIEVKEEIKMEHKKLEKPKTFNTKAEFITYQLLKNYNIQFIKEWEFTINYRIWELSHFPRLFCFSEYSSNLYNQT